MKKTWAHLHLPSLRAGVENVISVKVPGEKIAYVPSIVLADVEFKVHESGRQRCIREGSRNVHAWVVGEARGQVPTCFKPDWPGMLKKAIYDPWKGNSFVNAETLIPVYRANTAILIGKDVYYV